MISFDGGNENRNDSAEDVRRVIEHGENNSGGVENVRACCDGESSLSGSLMIVC